MPIRLWWNLGIVCPLVTGIGRFMSQEAEDLWSGPPEVTTNTWSAAGLMLAHGALGVRYIPLEPVSAIAVSEGVTMPQVVILPWGHTIPSQDYQDYSPV